MLHKVKKVDVDKMSAEERENALKNNVDEIFSYVLSRLDDPSLDEECRKELSQISEQLHWTKNFYYSH